MSQKIKYPRKLSIYLTDDLFHRLDRIADSKGSRVSVIIREILINYLNER